MISNKEDIKIIFNEILKINKITDKNYLETHFVNLDQIDTLDINETILLLDSELDLINSDLIDNIFLYEKISSFQDEKVILFFRMSAHYFYIQKTKEFGKMQSEDFIKVKSLSPIKIINYIRQKHNFEESFLEKMIAEDFINEFKNKCN